MNTGRTLNTIPSFFSVVVAVPLFFIVFGCMSAVSNDAAAVEKKSCVTSKCHANMGKEKYVHGPVSVGQCTICHVLTAEHAFKPIENVGKLCNQCHDKEFTGKVTHPPVLKGECTGCHDSHQSPYEFMLRGEGENLCFICHDKKIIAGEFIHGPVAVGGCSVCHQPHSSDYPKLLLDVGNAACYSCHFTKEESFKEKKHMHSPVEEACILCHSPHSGNYEYNFAADGSQDLCLGCHDDIKEIVEDSKNKHGGLETERKCLGCHDAHVSDYPKQLLKEPLNLCISCHDREYGSGKTRVANMKPILNENKIHHGPIKQNDCSACHSPHGSNNFRILREYFPPVFYAPYDASNYKLCFMCHEQTIAQEKFTTTLTGFRNGKQNLHYVHVNLKVKGRTCRACHDAHATNNPKHIRDGVPFGAWNLPINFEKTAAGGQCLPGCHQLFKYDREKEVFNR